MLRVYFLLLIAVTAVSCGGSQEDVAKAIPRDAAGHALLDPTPEGAVQLPNGTSSLVIEGEDSAQIYAFDGRIFNITFTRPHGGGEEVSEIIDKAIQRFGEPTFSDAIVYRFEDDSTLATLRIGRRSYTISLADKALTARALGGSEDKVSTLLQIPLGKSIEADGYQDGNEWFDALPLGTIQVEEEWVVSVFVKHDGENLLVAFYNVQPEDERFITAEVLIDLDGSLASRWEGDDYWFHASYNDCEAVGTYNVWECEPELPGWQANNLPLVPPGMIEFSISFEKLGIAGPSGTRLGFAVDVTDTQERWLLWPENATLESPATWAIVYLE